MRDRVVLWGALVLALVGHLQVLTQSRFLAPGAGTTLMGTVLLLIMGGGALVAALWWIGERRVPTPLVVALALLLMGRTLAFAAQHPTSGGGWRQPYISALGFRYETHREAWLAIEKACAVRDAQDGELNAMTFGTVDADDFCRRGAVLPAPRFSGRSLGSFLAVGAAVLALAGGLLVGRSRTGSEAMRVLLAWPGTWVVLVVALLVMRAAGGFRQLEGARALSLLLACATVLVTAAAATYLAPRLHVLADPVPREALLLVGFIGGMLLLLLLGAANHGVAFTLSLAVGATLLAALPHRRLFVGTSMIAFALVSIASDDAVFNGKLGTRWTATRAAFAPAPEDAAARARLAPVTAQMRTAVSLMEEAGSWGAGFAGVPGYLDRNFGGDTVGVFLIAVAGVPIFVAVVGLVALMLVELRAPISEQEDPFAAYALAGLLTFLGVQYGFALALPLGIAPVTGLSAPLLAASGTYTVMGTGCVGLLTGMGLRIRREDESVRGRGLW